MGQDGGQLGIVARQQPAWHEDRPARYCDGLVELEPSPVCGERRGGRRVLEMAGRRRKRRSDTGTAGLRAAKPVADRIEARFGSRGDVGLQLRGEPFAHLASLSSE